MSRKLFQTKRETLAQLLSIEQLQVELQDPMNDRQGRVLRGVDLTVAPGERVALVGESGCGKSVTALSILHLLPQPPMRVISGRVIFKEKDMSGFGLSEWQKVRGKAIGMVFQDPMSSLNPVLRVGWQIEETLRNHLGLSETQMKEKVRELLNQVGLPDPARIAEQYPHQLSGGMCQRVMIAMAVACGPELLIADEPTTALDVTVQAQILDLLFKMTQQKKMAVLLITHDLRIVKEHADRVVILYAGEIVEEGKPADLFEHPRHPYTEGLLASMPEFAHRGQALASMSGSVPSPFEPLPGCVFVDRCPKAEVKCRQEKPELIHAETGQGVRCFYPSKK